MAIGYIDPSDLKASELKALVAILKNGGKAPISHGICLAGSTSIRWKTFLNLIDIGAVVKSDNYLMLSRAGLGIARIFQSRKIQGTD